MSDELALDRTHAPSPRRRQQARRDGHVARSTDLTSAVLLLAALLALKVLGPAMLESWRRIAVLLFAPAPPAAVSPAEIQRTISQVVWHAAVGVVPLLLFIMLAAVLANLAQTGFVFAPARLRFRPDALNPAHNLARIAGVQSLLSCLMSLARLAAVCGVGWLAMRAELPRLVALQAQPLSDLVPAGASIVLNIGLKLAAVLLGLGLLDYAWQCWRHERDLRLTPQEAREEARRTDGDPQIRQRRRMAARASSRSRGAPQIVH